MPFNAWCEKCQELIGKGVRFNAEKQQTGQYHSTKIWTFTMHHHCGSVIKVRTDPKSCEYIIESGAHRKVRAAIVCYIRNCTISAYNVTYPKKHDVEAKSE